MEKLTAKIDRNEICRMAGEQNMKHIAIIGGTECKDNMRDLDVRWIESKMEAENGQFDMAIDASGSDLISVKALDRGLIQCRLKIYFEASDKMSALQQFIGLFNDENIMNLEFDAVCDVLGTDCRFVTVTEEKEKFLEVVGRWVEDNIIGDCTDAIISISGTYSFLEVTDIVQEIISATSIDKRNGNTILSFNETEDFSRISIWYR